MYTYGMTSEKSSYTVELAQVLTQAAIELAYRRKIHEEISFAGDPAYEAVVQRFRPLLSQVEKAEGAEASDQTSLDAALQSLLKEVKTLFQPFRISS